MIRDEDIIRIAAPRLTAAERLYLPQVLDGMKTTLTHLFRRPVTVKYPEEKRALRVDNHRGLHRLNRDEQGRVACVACFMCSTACPAHCIHIVAGDAPWPDREKYPVQFDIDELRCIYCGMCEEACPVDAIELTPEYDFVGTTREQMVLDKEELLAVYDRTCGLKPRKNPRITGYPGTGHRGQSVPRPPADEAT
ncbi:MAG TPA: NADH-quinone oxidoreductase subunit I [Phycisphaerae bacterium]|nr:NADH-quinone oxidoreductase subunit I [Phycisphaerae bacterium]HNU44919.1 NADH-quinone oxidoreductase subunit I [Phycisphaerae bacterium]